MMAGKRLVDRLDDAARSTGFQQFSARFAVRSRRPMRGLAIAVLAFGTIGLAVALASQPLFWVGQGVLMLGFSLSVWLPIFGPIKPWMTAGEHADERDEAVRANAYLMALPVILLVGVFGLIGLPLLATLQHRNPYEAIALGGLGSVYLILLWNSVPTLHASWNAPADDED